MTDLDAVPARFLGPVENQDEWRDTRSGVPLDRGRSKA